MLYVGCGNCRSVVPLFCAGRFMPHVPLYLEGGPMGIFCGMCGPLPPIFTCMLCGVTQLPFWRSPSTAAHVARRAQHSCARCSR